MSRNMYKGPKDKAEEGKDGGWEVGVGGAEGSGGRKMETTVSNNNNKKKEKGNLKNNLK